MINERAFSFLETILTVAILFFLFGTMLPLANNMHMQIAKKKASLHAAIAMNDAAGSVEEGIYSGTVMLDGIEYHWSWEQPNLCVTYTFLGTGAESCSMF